ALYSLLAGKPVRPDLAMTGEITLRGQVLQVGGLKEKILAAKLAGVTHILIPRRNEKDLGEISQSVLEGLTFHFADRIDDVLEVALVPAPASKPRKKKAVQPRKKSPGRSKTTRKERPSK
ncbi:MAG: endopeptidase La, partial [Candidatus Omnitrophica bacterium]|nr:endopeptidase La [Candidatus Omnitrophota bacterium]